MSKAPLPITAVDSEGMFVLQDLVEEAVHRNSGTHLLNVTINGR